VEASGRSGKGREKNTNGLVVKGEGAKDESEGRTRGIKRQDPEDD